MHSSKSILVPRNFLSIPFLGNISLFSRDFLRYVCGILGMLITVTVTAQTKMSSGEAEALKTLVRARAAETKTVTSDFTQFKHLDFLSNDIESKGKLAFKAPDLVKWEYIQPFAYTIIFKDQSLYINDDGNKSNLDVGASKLFKQLNGLIASSIRGDMFDDTQFDITYFLKEGKNEVHFMPKDPQFAEFIQRFQITFNQVGEVDEVRMIEPSGDYTHIIFSGRKTNQPLSDADFAQ